MRKAVLDAVLREAWTPYLRIRKFGEPGELSLELFPNHSDPCLVFRSSKRTVKGPLVATGHLSEARDIVRTLDSAVLTFAEQVRDLDAED